MNINPNSKTDLKKIGSKNKVAESSGSKKKETVFFSITKAFRDNVLTNATVSLGNSIELPALFRRLGWRLLSACSSRPVKFTSRLKHLGQFGEHLLALTRKHGAAYTVIYLKSCQLAVQKCIAGSPLTSLKSVGGDLPFPYLDQTGLPRCIPMGDRVLIRKGVFSMIRWWLTLFAVYRVIKIPGILKLNTITDESTALPADLEEIGLELSVLSASLIPVFPKIDGEDADLQLIEKASPTHRTSWTGALRDLQVLKHFDLIEPMVELMDAFNTPKLRNLFNILGEWFTVASELPSSDTISSIIENSNFYFKKDKEGGIAEYKAGQLSIKDEPAGKVRVFALVDIWTQSILKPLHDSIFSFLKSIPNDATFDQRASVKRCFEKVAISKSSWGYDLSAATDRLPVSIQEKILSNVIGTKAASCWKKLLVDRTYVLRDEEYGSASVRYKVGQPMGALSSWAMLALTHHLIVQLAYQKSRISEKGSPMLHIKHLGPRNSIPWFTNYELLGDDIVIFDSSVATAYLSLMSRLGVSINVSKSVIATTEAFEFAKVTGFKSVDVSALPWKAFISQNTMIGRVNIVFSLLGRQLQISNWVRWFTQICKHKKYNEGDLSISILALWTMFANSGKITYCTVLQSIYDLDNPTLKFYKSLVLKSNKDYVLNQISKILRGDPPTPRSSGRLAAVWNIEEPWMKLTLTRRLLMYKHKSVLFGPLCPDTRAVNLSRNVVRALGYNDIPVDLMSTTFDPNWSEFEALTNAVWLGWYMLFKKHFLRLTLAIGDPNFLNLPIDDIISLNESLDRLEELDQILERAKAKALGAKVDNVLKVDSPLKSIKHLLTMRKRRPGWTSKPSMYKSIPNRIPWDKKITLENLSVIPFVPQVLDLIPKTLLVTYSDKLPEVPREAEVRINVSNFDPWRKLRHFLWAEWLSIKTFVNLLSFIIMCVIIYLGYDYDTDVNISSGVEAVVPGSKGRWIGLSIFGLFTTITFILSILIVDNPELVLDDPNLRILILPALHEMGMSLDEAIVVSHVLDPIIESPLSPMHMHGFWE